MATSTKATPVATPEMLNAIRDEASATYQAAVPVATALNLQEVGNPIINNYQGVGNEWLSAIMNKIVMTIYRRKMFDNPLSMLKKEPIALGYDIEELNVNPATGVAYDATETGMADILKKHDPDVASAYHRLNRQEKYPVTVFNETLTNAFLSWGNMENFIAGLVDSLYNGNTIDEFKYTKQLISDALTGAKITTINTVNPVDSATARQFQAALRGLSLSMTFPSTEYNNYIKMGGTGNPRVTWSPVEDQLIILSSQVAANVGVELLSGAFNLSFADYSARQIIVDKFDAPNVIAVLADVNAFQIREKLRRFTEFYNASTMSWQYYLHAWDVFSMSPFYNCVALVAA